MSTATKNHENGSPISAAGNEGIAGSAVQCVSQENINQRFCAYRGHGCIHQYGYRCAHNGPCEPVDSDGRRFVVFAWLENGQPLATRHYLDDINGMPLKQGNKAVCAGTCMCQPENHGGRGACGKVIDADEANKAIALVKELRS